MKYRCKLCGQPKQNHNCPYRQSMQRSIGVSVQPAINAYEAREPGLLAPALSEMNNFVDRSDQTDNDVPSYITAEKREDSAACNSPNFSASEITPPSSSGSKGNLGRKRKHSDALSPRAALDSKFVESVPLCREQYRAVSISHSDSDFKYTPFPLSFQERKKLSDTLFALSKEISHLTDEIACILREARERELWDLAVAEIMTQVIVALHCVEGDKRLDGLQHYLLKIGIAC